MQRTRLIGTSSSAYSSFLLHCYSHPTTRLLGWGPNHFDLADPGTALVIRIRRDGTSWYCSPAGGPWLAGPAGGWQ